MKKNIYKVTLLSSLVFFLMFCLLSCSLICKHNYVEVSKQEATCKEEGYIIKQCSLCEKKVKETINKIPHDYKEEVISPTCTEEGYTLKTCQKCQYEVKENISKPLGHLFGAWDTQVIPTEISDGLKVRKCTRCPYEEKEIISSVSYINLNIIKEPFDSNILYTCTSYEELLLMFNCAILKNATKLKCKLEFEYESLQSLLNDLCDDEEIPTAFHVDTKLSNNIFECTFEYTIKPELSSTYTYYQQYDSLNITKTNETRPSDFDNFAINNSLYIYDVETSDQLFYALERGVKPHCALGSKAEVVYQEMKKVLRTIINDNMTDVEKVIAIHDYLIMNVTYDEEVINLLYQNITNASNYQSFYLEGVFLDKKAVCEGISKAFASMCNVEGIPCVMVEGKPKANPQGAGHAWNKVYVNGNWYIVDITSDGAIIDKTFEVVSYKYCLIDETNINNTYIAKNYNDIKCNNSINIYKEQTFIYNGKEYDFDISSMEELIILIKYFEESNQEKTTVEFYLSFDYGTDCKDEVLKAYQEAGYVPNFTFINSKPIFMLIKGEVL